MKFYRTDYGVIRTVGSVANAVEITEDEYTATMRAVEERGKKRDALIERTRPLTESEVSRLFIQQNINTVIKDDETASRAVVFHPVMKYDGALIPHGTRINWNGQLKRTTVDIWDTEANSPDNAPALWEDISYRNGFRVIPETITAGTAFAKGEYGWWSETLYQSTIDNNVWTPAAYPAGWEVVDT